MTLSRLQKFFSERYASMKQKTLLKPIRVFFAVALDEQTRLVLGKIIDTLKKQPNSKGIRWVSPQHLHMTIRFVGNISPAKAPVLMEHVRKKIRSIPPFHIQFDRILPFPSKMKPQVLAVDIQYSQMLQNLFQEVEHAIVEFGLPEEKRIQRAHITLGRFKEGFVPQLDVSLANLRLGMKVEHIAMIESIQNERGGTHYQLLDEAYLGKIIAP